VTTVAASHLGLKRYDRAKVDGLRMSSDQIDAVVNEYLALGPRAARRPPHRQGPARAHHVGLGDPQALMRLWPTDRLSVADRGPARGLLYAQMSADGVLEDAL
jgi:exopolyphosphatase/guanosine-5'-triphosphate,3'-diphosphate pyrophosphatase